MQHIVSKRLKPESNLSLSSRWAEKQFKLSSHCCITSDVLSIKQLLDREELYFYVAGATTFIYCCKRSFLKTHACLEISSDLWVNFLLKELVSAGKSYFIYDFCKVSGLQEDVGEIYCITDDKEKCHTEKALAKKLIDRTKNTAGRLLLTVGPEYKKLWLTHRHAPFGFTKVFFMQPNNGKLVLLPYWLKKTEKNNIVTTTEESDLEKLFETIQPWLENQQITIADIRAEYKRLIDYIDNTLMPSQYFGKEWAQVRGLPLPSTSPPASTTATPTDPTPQ